MLAGARAALPDGRAGDLLTWLRTPGRLEDPAAADRLEVRVRRRELRTAARARRAWEEELGGAPLTALDALAAAADEGAAALLGALEAETQAIWTAPHRRRGEVLGPEDRADARVAADLRSAAGELRQLAAADEALLGTPRDVLDALGAARVREPLGADAAAGVLLAGPLEIRARRFRAVFVCGLQDGELPARPIPNPFLSDDDRRALASATGLRLPLHEDVLDRERSLFYAAVSRPEDTLFLSWRSSDEEGEPLAASAFLDDVRALFTDELWEQRGTRLLADVTWAPKDAPTPHELRRAYAAAATAPEPEPLAAPATDAVRGLLAARRTEPARGLESFAACGVAWLVDSMLRPDRIDPDPDAMRRGSLAHALLEKTLALLKERTGAAAITPERLDAALEALRDTLAEDLRTGGAPARRKALLRGLEADLERYLRTEAEAGAGYEPDVLEWSFGTERDAHPPLPLGDGRDAGHGPRRPRRRWARTAPRSSATTRAAPSPAARSGRSTGSCRSRSTCSPCASCWGWSRWPASTSRSRAASSARAGSCARARPAPTRAPTSSTTPASRRRWRRRASSRSGRPRSSTPAGSRPAPSAARAAAAATRRSAAPGEPKVVPPA